MMHLATKAAAKSNHSMYKMGSVITKGGRILAVAANKVNCGCQVIKKKKWNNTLHAEAHAIAKLLKHDRLGDLLGSNLYVTRINKHGKAMNSKPCEFCESLAKSVGIYRIIYHNEQGETCSLKL